MTIGFADFAGQWSIDRVISDKRAGSMARFTGVAGLTPDQGGLRYAEKGQLVLAGAAPITAERQYIWHPQDGGVDVFFDDGRFFHRFYFSNSAKAAHWCDPDQYDVEYEFADWPKWTATWAVKGPRKDYVMTSRYSRSV